MKTTWQIDRQFNQIAAEQAAKRRAAVAEHVTPGHEAARGYVDAANHDHDDDGTHPGETEEERFARLRRAPADDSPPEVDKKKKRKGKGKRDALGVDVEDVAREWDNPQFPGGKMAAELHRRGLNVSTPELVTKDWQYGDCGETGADVTDPDGDEGQGGRELRYEQSRLGHPAVTGPTEAVGSPVDVPVPEGVFRPSDITSALGKRYSDGVYGPGDYTSPESMTIERAPEHPYIRQGHAAASPGYQGPRVTPLPTSSPSQEHRFDRAAVDADFTPKPFQGRDGRAE